MKILVLSFYYYPDLCAGSFRSTALVEQLRQMTEKTVDIDVITTLPNRYASFTATAPQFEQQDRVTIHRIALPPHCSGMIDQTKAFVHFIKAVNQFVKRRDYDLVFATSSRLMTATLGAWIAYRKKTKLYLDIRDLFVDTLHDVLPTRLSLWIKPIFSCVEKWTFTRAHRINVVSKGFYRYFSQRYPTIVLSHFTNGVDREFIEAGLGECPDPSHTLTVLYAGNIGEGQGLHTIVPFLANKMEGRIRFQVIGDGGRIKQLKAALESMHCHHVSILPPMDRAGLIQAYQRADILFLHLNDYKAFHQVLPSKVFEYAAMGKPIWAGVAGYPAEFIATEISNAAIFHPGDSAEAEVVFSTLKLECQPRTQFITKYARDHIMQAMASDILSLLEA